MCGIPKAPSSFYLKALQQRLQDFKGQIPPELLQDSGLNSKFISKVSYADTVNSEVLQLQIYSTELVIHEVALSKGDHFGPGPDLQRLDCLFSCLNAIRHWFEIFLTLPIAEYFGVSMAVCIQLAHCMIALYRLSTFECQEWDRSQVRNFANLSEILDRLISNFAQVKTTLELDQGILEDKDIFYVTSRTLSHIKTWWDSKITAEPVGPDSINLDESMGEVPMDFFDDAWLQDVLGIGPYRFDAFGQ